MNLDLSSLTFLVVEDSAYMRTILRTMLQGFGARRIVEAEDGASGLEAMDRANPDILILDWVMPILDGADMVRMIRNPQNPFAYVPVIMVTAHTERSRILEARKLGIHEIHYSMVLVCAMNVGLMMPPIGVGFYVACRIGDASPDEVMAAIWPYLLALLVGVVVIAAFPVISTVAL